MTLAAVEKRCASRPDAVLTMPFGPHVHVYKTAGKMFALCGRRNGVEAVTLKCDPERSTMLRLTFPAVTGGYHLNKEHWNTIVLDGTVPAALLTELIDHAHEIVTPRPKKTKTKTKTKTKRATSKKRRARRGSRRGA